MNARHDGMTSLCEPLRTEVAAACLRLFGFKEKAPARARVETPDDIDIKWRVLVEIPIGNNEDLLLEVFPSPGTEKKRSEWAKVDGYAVRCRRLRDGREPKCVPEFSSFLEQLQNNFVASGEGEGEMLRSFQTAVDNFTPFAEIDDFELRQVTLGLYGWTGTLRVGFRCNQDCGFCWQGRSWPDPPEEFPLIWLNEFNERGVKSLNLSGGEPTLYKSLPEIIRRARSYGMGVQLETNAIRFTRPKYTQEIIEAGLSGALVSYHSPDAETSDLLTKAPTTHDATERGIMALLEAKRPDPPYRLSVSLNCVIQKENFNQLVQHAQRVVEKFVIPYPNNPVREVVYTFPTLYFDMSLWEDSIVALDEIRPHLNKAARILVDAGVTVQCLGTCGFPPCMLNDVPEAIWSYPVENAQPMDKAARTYGDQCDDCGMKSGCLGMRHEYFRLFGDRGLIPFPPDYVPTNEQTEKAQKMNMINEDGRNLASSPVNQSS